MKTEKTHINYSFVIKNFFFLIAVLLLFNNCVEEIEFNDSEFDKLLIVKANLTDEFKIQKVELSRVNALKSNEDTFETKAIVTIVENSQKTYSFNEIANGVYESNLPFKAELGKEYSLHIKTLNGEKYSSTPQKIEAINDIDAIKIDVDSNKFNEKGVRIYITSENQDTKANYYKYTYEETYNIKPPYWSRYKFVVHSPRSIGINEAPTAQDLIEAEARRVCYKTEKSIDLIHTETKSLSTNSVHKFPLIFIKKTNSKIRHRYSILVKQYIQSYDAYTYTKTLKKLSTSEDVFTQVQQGFLPGNMYSESNINKKVIGFFEVNSVSQKRVFFNFLDLFTKHDLPFIRDCEIEAPLIVEATDGSVNYPLYEAITVRKLRFARINEVPTIQLPGPFKITSKECVDCRFIASNVKPNFWID